MTLPGTTPQAASGSIPPMVTCDLCESPMQLPPGAVRNGQIIGLLVCTQCTEDSLDARAFNARSEVGLARSCGGR